MRKKSVEILSGRMHVYDLKRYDKCIYFEIKEL